MVPRTADSEFEGMDDRGKGRRIVGGNERAGVPDGVRDAYGRRSVSKHVHVGSGMSVCLTVETIAAARPET